jgi:excisionase family DNA binding protein
MSLARAILAELDDDALDDLAARLAPLLAERLRTEPVDDDRRWMSTRDAATYLGIPTSSLHKLTAAREIPFEQDGPGCRCWFRRAELDRWRRGEPATSSLRRVA